MTNIKPSLRPLLVTAVVVAALAIPAQSAFAAGDCTGATGSQYCQVQGVNTGSNNGGQGNGPGTEAVATETSSPVELTPAAVETEAVESSGSTLPFTGLDVGILLLVAAALGGAGLVLRRLTATGAPRS